jgi:adenosylcobinamide-phosphate synthase
MLFLPWQFALAYVADLVFGDPQWLPHPTRWIGHWITRVERIFYDGTASPTLQRLAGCAFWLAVMAGVFTAAMFVIELAAYLSPVLAQAVMIWLAFMTLATRNLHQESSRVVEALRGRDLAMARERLAMIVSRDTGALEERDILRAVIETVAENISDGIIAPLFYLALGGPVAALLYKAVNTMDSMVGYQNDRYSCFGWWTARFDDVANWIPARLSGLILVAASACLKLDWGGAWQVMRRDARKMKSPNAGYPEAAAAGALGVQLGGTNFYFGQAVEKPTLGDAVNPMTIDTYRRMVRLMYLTSLLAFGLALGGRWLMVML